MSELAAVSRIEEPELVAVPAARPITAPPLASVAAAPFASPGVERTAAPTHAGAAPTRRTIKIQGRGAERNLPLPASSRRRPSRRAYERAGFRPDRLAMWAVMLGFLLVLIAIISAHG